MEMRRVDPAVTPEEWAPPPEGLRGLGLADLVQLVDQPDVLLRWAYDRLAPGGVLAFTLTDRRRLRGAERFPGGHHLLSGEVIPALMFREGFEAPRLLRRNGHHVVVARRGSVKPPWCRPLRLSVIMPVLNEHATFATVMEKLLAKDIPGIELEIIVVDSNSTDGTREDALKYASVPGIQVLTEDIPRGKGHAVRQGLKVATGDFLLIQDADLEYDLDDYEKLLEPLRHCEAGFVLGMRTSPDGSWGVRRFGQDNLISHTMNVGHTIFLALFNLVYRQRLRDPFTMYKVFRRDCIDGLAFECNRFDFDWELTAKLVRAGFSPLEIPVFYESRSFRDGKKVRLFRDPPSWIRACFRYRVTKLYAEPDRIPWTYGTGG